LVNPYEFPVNLRRDVAQQNFGLRDARAKLAPPGKAAVFRLQLTPAKITEAWELAPPVVPERAPDSLALAGADGYHRLP